MSRRVGRWVQQKKEYKKEEGGNEIKYNNLNEWKKWRVWKEREKEEEKKWGEGWKDRWEGKEIWYLKIFVKKREWDGRKESMKELRGGCMMLSDVMKDEGIGTEVGWTIDGWVERGEEKFFFLSLSLRIRLNIENER